MKARRWFARGLAAGRGGLLAGASGGALPSSSAPTCRGNAVNALPTSDPGRTAGSTLSTRIFRRVCGQRHHRPTGCWEHEWGLVHGVRRLLEYHRRLANARRIADEAFSTRGRFQIRDAAERGKAATKPGRDCFHTVPDRSPQRLGTLWKASLPEICARCDVFRRY